MKSEGDIAGLAMYLGDSGRGMKLYPQLRSVHRLVTLTVIHSVCANLWLRLSLEAGAVTMLAALTAT